MPEPEPDSSELSRYTGLSPFPATPPREDPAEAEAAEFARRLRELTPRVVVTPVLIAVNVAVFILMVVFGVSPVNPLAEDLIRWGANFGPVTMNGEWWRLLTSNYLHIGLLHLVVNMWVLKDVGPLVERLVGNVGFLLLYTVSGLVGSTARLYWDLDIISAGASGAVFGVWGALLGFLIWRRDSVPAEVLVSLRNSGVTFLGYNLVFGLFVQGIDHAAHLGGLAAGILCGLTLSQPLTGEARLGRPFRNALVAVGGILVLASALLLLPKGKSSFAAVMIRFEETEKKVLNSYNDAIDRARAGQLTDEDFAKLLEREILPDWRSLRGDLDQLQNVKADRVRMLAQLKDYAKLREEHWAAFLDALRDPDPAKLAEARRKGEVVDEALKQLGAAVK